MINYVGIFVWLFISVINFVMIKILGSESIWIVYIQFVFYAFFYYVIWAKQTSSTNKEKK